MGDDWPLTYEDLSPYYDKVESFIGVFGSKENISSAPDGIFLPPPPPRCTELMVKKTCDKLNILCVPSRMAILTKPLNGRKACHYCGQCGRGCVTASNFSSKPGDDSSAQATGKLTLITGAMARELTLGKDGKAEAVVYIDKATRTEKRINARSFIVAASACESARLLLNSRSSSFPDGMANNNGVVGRYLTDSVGSSGAGYFPSWRRCRPQPRRRRRNASLHAVVEVRPQERLPARLPHRIRRRTRHARRGEFEGVCEQSEGYGASLKQKCRSMYGTYIGFAGRGEMIPNEHSYCDLDPNVVDKWGIPVLRFHWKWSENEVLMAKDMQETFKSIVESAGGTYISRAQPGGDNPYGIADGA